MDIFEILHFKKGTNDVSTVFKSDKAAISAEHAYQKSRFGCLKTDKELLDEFFQSVRNLIAEKNLNGKYCGMIEVCSDIVEFIPQIVDKLSKELGYKVVVLDDDVEIHNKKTGTKCNMTTGTTFIVLIWNKDAVEAVMKENRKNYVNTEKIETIPAKPDINNIDA